MTVAIEDTVRDWTTRLERAEGLFREGNLTRAASLVSEVEREAERARAQSAIGSDARGECTRIVKRARVLLDRFENAAGIDDDEDDEDDET